jgi:hypothetical protein
VALVGGLAYLIPHRVARLIAQSTHPEDDLAASVKLGTSIVLFPLWAIGLAAWGWHLAGWAGLIAFGPGLGAAAFWALWFLERERSAVDDTRAFFLLLRHARLRSRLLGTRARLADELELLGKEAGVFPAADFQL